MAIKIDVDKSGPVFNGSADDIMDAYVSDMTRALGQDLVNMIQNDLRRVIKDRSGNYERHITTTRASSGATEVTGGNVVYGPWLEGVSSRNKSTRFKGYATFRRMTQEYQKRAASEAERVFESRYLGRLN
jgi:hypothetical protein